MKQQDLDKTYPEWVSKYIEPGTEIHIIDGRYYLYRYEYEYYKETQKHKKKSILVGRIVENIGLVRKGSNISIPRKPRARKKIPVIAKISDNMEYGIAFWMHKKIEPQYYHLIKQHFGICWQTIIGIAFCRLVFQSATRDMQRHFNNSFLSQMLPDARMGDKDIIDVLKFIGRNRMLQVNFFKEFSLSGNIILFDGMVHENGVCIGVNILNGVSVYMRCLPDNIKDVKAIKLCLKEFPSGTKITAIFDEGFFSEKNIKMLQKASVTYIIPLERNAMGKDGIDYDAMTLFNFESRRIQCCEMEQTYGSHTYLYLDGDLQYKEGHDAQTRLKFGTTIIITNSDLSAEATYKAYKNKDQIKKVINATKGVPDEDIEHMQNQDLYNGWMFCNFLALHWYYILRNMLIEIGEIKNFSPQNILTELGYHQILKVNEEWTVVERTKDQQDILGKLGLEVVHPLA